MSCCGLESFALVPLLEHSVFATVAGNFAADVRVGRHDRGVVAQSAEATSAKLGGGVETRRALVSGLGSTVRLAGAVRRVSLL